MLYLVTNNDSFILANDSDFMPLTDYEGDYGEENTYYFLVTAKNDNDLAQQIAQYCKLMDETFLTETLTWHCYPM